MSFSVKIFDQSLTPFFCGEEALMILINIASVK